MAAAALMAVVGAGVATDPGYAYELAAVNEIEIPDMSVSEEAMVQVMQFEADAPTIIFIDVADEPSEADGDEGTTLSRLLAHAMLFATLALGGMSPQAAHAAESAKRVAPARR